FRDFTDYADHVDFLVRTNSIVEHTQLWWSVRPHHTFGTVELRICDAQTSAEESTALAGLAVACAAQAALDHDDRVPPVDAPHRPGRAHDRPGAARGVPVGGAARSAARLDRAGAEPARNRPRPSAPGRRTAPARRAGPRRLDRRGVRRGGRDNPLELCRTGGG